MSVHVEVRNAAGDVGGSFEGAPGFSKWRCQLKKRLGGKRQIACLIDETLIVDAPSLMDALPEARYNAVLLERAPIPPQVRRQLASCDLWKAV